MHEPKHFLPVLSAAPTAPYSEGERLLKAASGPFLGLARALRRRLQFSDLTFCHDDPIPQRHRNPK
jgi:hypothetical protein